MPPLVIFLAVIGSIYSGWATATEAAALGVVGALGDRRLARPADAGACCAMPARARCARPR